MVRSLLAVGVAAVVLTSCLDPTTGSPPPVGAPVPTFSSTITTVSGADLGASWRPGCPVAPADLRRVRVSYWDYAGAPRQGDLILHRDVASNVAAAFAHLYDQRFQIARITPVSVFDGDDDASMAANNTSAFNCRPVAGTSTWSEHAHGRAIDINPIQNPYVSSSGSVDPPAGAPWADRSHRVPGMVHFDGPVVRAFAFIGWRWGGRWTSVKDYQHLSLSGR